MGIFFPQFLHFPFCSSQESKGMSSSAERVFLHFGHLLLPVQIPGSSLCNLQTSIVVKLPRRAPLIPPQMMTNISDIIESIKELYIFLLAKIGCVLFFTVKKE